jgi:hypothetical protein
LRLPLGAEVEQRAGRCRARQKVRRRDLARPLAFQICQHCAPRIGGNRRDRIGRRSETKPMQSQRRFPPPISGHGPLRDANNRAASGSAFIVAKLESLSVELCGISLQIVH